jgi:hypothetical protein
MRSKHRGSQPESHTTPTPGVCIKAFYPHPGQAGPGLGYSALNRAEITSLTIEHIFSFLLVDN